MQGKPSDRKKIRNLLSDDGAKALQVSIANEINMELEARISEIEIAHENQFNQLRADYRKRDWFLVGITTFAFLDSLLCQSTDQF